MTLSFPNLGLGIPMPTAQKPVQNTISTLPKLPATGDSYTFSGLSSINKHQTTNSAVKFGNDGNDSDSESDVMNEMTDLERAATFGDVERVRELLREGADVNEQDDMGDTALHIASREGHTNVVRVLLGRQGININIQNYDTPSETARDIAARNNHRAIVRLLDQRQGGAPGTMRTGAR